MKVCSKCGIEKPKSEFSKRKDSKDGLRSYCKVCKREYDKKYQQENKDRISEQRKEFYQENRDKIAEKAKKYRQENRDKISEYNKKLYQENKEKKNKYRQENREKIAEYKKEYYQENREKFAEKAKKYRQENREKLNVHIRNRYKTDVKFKTSRIMRSQLRRVIKAVKGKKYATTSEILGYTSEHLATRIEFQFKDGMSWDNYGEWHIDHKKPVARFVDQGIDDPKIINALCNLQPLWAEENLSKSCTF